MLAFECAPAGSRQSSGAQPSAQERVMQRLIFILAALILGASAQAQAQRPPNVVLVMMDDWVTATLAVTVRRTSKHPTSTAWHAMASA
jgi:hypothetical protein